MPTTEVLRPTGDTTIIEWSIYPTSPTTHYDKVSEATSDDDATYIYPNASTNRDWYTKGTIASGTPLSVRVKINARREAAGTSDVNLTLKSGAARSNKTVTIDVTTYTIFSQTWDISPFTNKVWTLSEINGLEFGVTALSSSLGIRITQVWMEVDLADNTVSITDAGVGVDAVASVQGSVSVADMGSGTDGIILQNVNISIFEFGVEQIKAVEIGDVFDHTVGNDVVSLTGDISITDAGVGVDAVASVQGSVPVADTGSGVDTIRIAKAYFCIDSFGILHPLNMLVLRDSRYDLLPQTRENTEEIPGRHGEIDFGSELRPRILEIHVASKEEFDPKQREQVKRTLVAYLNPLLGVQDLIFADDIEKTYQVKYAGKIDLTQYANWISFVIPFKASQPFIIGTWEKQQTGSGTLTNEGTVETPLVIEIAGPVTDPSVVVGGKTLSYIGSLASGDNLVINTGTMTVTLNGANALANYSGGFPKLQPGNTAVTAASAGTTIFRWRDRWI